VLAAILSIVFDLQEEGALVAPHVVEHVGDEVPGDGDEGDEVALVGRLTVLDALVHLLVLGHPLAQVEGEIDGSVAAVGRTLLGDVLGRKEGSCRRGACWW
jgi:hypothetical protein